jgi:hypothetical protein
MLATASDGLPRSSIIDETVGWFRLAISRRWLKRWRFGPR